jgi:hypothetical protein
METFNCMYGPHPSAHISRPNYKYKRALIDFLYGLIYIPETAASLLIESIRAIYEMIKNKVFYFILFLNWIEFFFSNLI